MIAAFDPDRMHAAYAVDVVDAGVRMAFCAST